MIALTACGAAHKPRTGGDDTELAIYRDAVFVRHRRGADLAPGSNEIVFAGIPRTVVPGSPGLRVVAGAAARVTEARHQVGDDTSDDVLHRWVGRDVVVSTGAGEVRGRLHAVAPRHLMLTDARGAEMRMVTRPVEVRGPGGDEGKSARLRWVVAAPRAGHRELEARYVARGLAWRAGYTLVLDAVERRSARLEGWLAIENHTGVDLAPRRAVLIDQPFARRPQPQAADGKSPQRGEPASPPAVPAPIEAPEEAPRGRTVALGARLRVARDTRVELPLLGSDAVTVPAALTAVFDPVGFRLDLRRRQPIAVEGYGFDPRATARTALDTHVEVDLAAGGVDPSRLPPGDCLVLERAATGALVAIGRARAFDRLPSDRREAGILRLAIGDAPDLVGRRRQTEFSYDADGRRLVEELRVTVENRRDVGTEVLVREHLYRGLNWALAYHNQVGRVTKEGPQEILFRMSVPARGSREVVYRVVYTW